MALNIRQKQADAVVRMLHLNSSPQSTGRGGEDLYKVLILDAATQDVLAPLLRVKDLRRHGVTLHLPLDSNRQPIPDVPAVYFVAPSPHSTARIVADLAASLYDSYHLNFSTQLPRKELEALAEGAAREGSAARVARVHDQYLQYIALEAGLFSLGLPATYVDLNDPSAQDAQIQGAVGLVVERLFCVLASTGTVPIIRCPRGGAAEHVASLLDAQIREALHQRGSVFADGAGAAGAGLAASLHRPLLAIFDRNFELSVMLQHAWTYKPLVHDVLGMRLNRVTLAAPGGAPGAATPVPKTFEVDDSDFFWSAHGREQFPKIAEQVEAELARYRAAVDELNRSAGSNVLDAAADPADLMAGNTKHLMSAINSLPELTERKRSIDKHTNLATHLLGAIKERGLDRYYALEEELTAGKEHVEAVLKHLQGSQGTVTDRLRLALVWLLTCPTAPLEAECERVETALAAAGADVRAWAYARRMRRMNLTGKSQSSAALADGRGVFGGAAQAQLTTLLGSSFGQGLSSLTKGVKNLLAGEQQAAVTVAVEALMEGRPNPDVDGYAYFDPKAPIGSGPRPQGPFKQAIVFMVGGGNFLEAESLQCWASRAQPTPKHVVYGATELLSPETMLEQLSALAVRGGL
ncbi:SLY1 [Auxenochlorella protothecoides x Auxenochlorella symbiontica]